MSLMEILLTIRQMISHPLMMVLHCLWLVVTFQEKSWIEKAQQLAEEDRRKPMPNEHIQGVALTVPLSRSLRPLRRCSMSILGHCVSAVDGSSFGIFPQFLDFLLETATRTN